MPRSNRPRGRPAGDDDEPIDLSRALIGRLATERKRNGTWNVRSLAAASANKSYVCPGCGREIVPRTPHLVIWRADGIMGEERDLAARRHWHSHCWKIEP